MLAFRDVSLSFGGVKAIDVLSFDVADGAVCALIGPNGAGKTSVLNIISGFYRPQHGSVHYGEVDVLRLPPYRVIHHGIARSFQNVALFPELSVVDNMLVGADHRGRSGLLGNMLRLPASRAHERAARRQAERVLGFLDIARLRDRRASELSFGDRKLVDMGRALMAEPSLLLLDEPGAGLAQRQKGWLGDVIGRIPAEFGATVLLIDHDMGLVLSVSSHVVVMEFGRKIGEGRPEQVRNDPSVIAAYLGGEVPAANVNGDDDPGDGS